MKVLKDAGIIQSEKTGYFVKYTIQEQHLYAIVDFIKELENKEPSMGCKLDKQHPMDVQQNVKAIGTGAARINLIHI
jgi:hypothetical protein